MLKFKLGCYSHSRGITLRLQNGPQAYGYTAVAFHPESKGIMIYIFPKDGSGTDIELSINHDIVH